MLSCLKLCFVMRGSRMFRSQAQRWNGQIGESQAVCSWLERLLEPLAVNGPKGFGGGGGVGG